MSHKDRDRQRPVPTDRTSDEKRRDRFAREMTRSEFGRHYWDHRREAELEKALRRKPKIPK